MADDFQPFVVRIETEADLRELEAYVTGLKTQIAVNQAAGKSFDELSLKLQKAASDYEKLHAATAKPSAKQDAMMDFLNATVASTIKVSGLGDAAATAGDKAAAGMKKIADAAKDAGQAVAAMTNTGGGLATAPLNEAAFDKVKAAAEAARAQAIADGANADKADKAAIAAASGAASNILNPPAVAEKPVEPSKPVNPFTVANEQQEKALQAAKASAEEYRKTLAETDPMLKEVENDIALMNEALENSAPAQERAKAALEKYSQSLEAYEESGKAKPAEPTAPLDVPAAREALKTATTEGVAAAEAAKLAVTEAIEAHDAKLAEIETELADAMVHGDAAFVGEMQALMEGQLAPFKAAVTTAESAYKTTVVDSAKKIADAQAALTGAQAAQAALPPPVDPAFVITTQTQLEAVRKLAASQDAYVKSLIPGTQAHTAAKSTLDAYNASLTTSTAILVQQQAQLEKEAALLQKAGNAALLAANQQQQANIANQLGQKPAAFSGLGNALASLHQSYQQAGGGVQGFISVLRGGVGVMATAAAGVGLLGYGAKQAADEFAKWQKAVTELDASLANSGKLTPAVREQYHALALELRNLTGKATREWIEVFADLNKYGADTGNIRKLSDGVKNLAGIMGGDLKRASDVLTRAMEGQYEGLTRIGIHVDETLEPWQRLDDLLVKIAAKGGGQFEALRNTVTGQREAMASAFDDFKAAVGQPLAEAATPWRQFWTDFFEGATNITRAAVGTTAVVGGLTNKLQNEKRSLEEASKAAKDHADALNKIKTEAEAAAKATESIISTNEKLARMEDEKKSAKLALAKAIVDEDERAGRITRAEAVRRREQLDVNFVADKASRDAARLKDKYGTLEGGIADAQKRQAEGTAGFERKTQQLETGGASFFKDKAALENFKAAADREIQQAKQENSKRQMDAQASGAGPTERKAIEEEYENKVAQHLDRMLLYERRKKQLDETAKSLGLEKGYESSDADFTESRNKLRKQAQEAVQKNADLIESLRKQLADVADELATAAAVNAANIEAANIRAGGRIDQAKREEDAQRRVDDAERRQAEIQVKMLELKRQRPSGNRDKAERALVLDAEKAKLDGELAAARMAILKAQTPEAIAKAKAELSALLKQQELENLARKRAGLAPLPLPTQQQAEPPKATATPKGFTPATPPPITPPPGRREVLEQQQKEAEANSKNAALTDAQRAKFKADADAKALELKALDERGKLDADERAKAAKDAADKKRADAAAQQAANDARQNATIAKANEARQRSGLAPLPTVEERRAAEAKTRQDNEEARREREREIARRLARQYQETIDNPEATEGERDRAKKGLLRQQDTLKRLGPSGQPRADAGPGQAQGGELQAAAGNVEESGRELVTATQDFATAAVGVNQRAASAFEKTVGVLAKQDERLRLAEQKLATLV